MTTQQPLPDPKELKRQSSERLCRQLGDAIADGTLQPVNPEVKPVFEPLRVPSTKHGLSGK